MLQSLVLFCFFSLYLVVPTTQQCVENGKVVCYYGSWAVHAEEQGGVTIEAMPGHLCTHLIYAFIGLHPDGSVKIIDPSGDLPHEGGKDGFRRFLALRNTYPNTKLMIAVGGGLEGSKVFSMVARDPTTRQFAVESLFNFVHDYGFDGLDVDWEFPALGEGSSPEDKGNFVALLSELRAKFSPNNLLLSAAVSSWVDILDQAYDIPAVQSYLDFINLMAYDYSGFEIKPFTDFNAPLYAQWASVDISLQAWIDRGTPRSKLILGVPLYGVTFTLADPGVNGKDAPAIGPGTPGPISFSEGFLFYTEICQKLLNGDWTMVMDAESISAYAYSSDQWVTYETLDTSWLKGDYARQQGLGGVMTWSVQSDDTQGVCGTDNFPLLINLRDGFIHCP